MTRAELDISINTVFNDARADNSLSPSMEGAELKKVADYVDKLVPFNQWIARISNTAVDVVIKDDLLFTAPVVANNFNGIITITKTGFFTGKTVSKIEVEVPNYFDGTSLYICSAQQDNLNPNDTIKILMFPKDGSITGTPSFSGLLVKLKIYN